MSIPLQVRRVARLLKERNLKVVFAESCTGGLVAGALTRVPGISEHHCGGMIVYRNATKQAYLGIAEELLEKSGPVSAAVAREMATRILDLTPEADISAAVTGHLGPGAPPTLDGVAYIAVAFRKPGTSKSTDADFRTVVQKHICRSEKRLARQKEIIVAVLSRLANVVEER